MCREVSSITEEYLLLALCVQSLKEEHLSQGVYCSRAIKKTQNCFAGMSELPRRIRSHTAANETLVDSLACKRTETGIRSGHNRKCSRDYMKRTDSLLPMLFCEEAKAFIPLGGWEGVLCSKALIITKGSCSSAAL